MIISLLLGTNALAFAPSDDVYIGMEPSRVMRYHTERQHALRHGPGWQSFLNGAGKGWMARFDERAGTAFRAWGPGIPMGQPESVAQAGRAVLDLLAKYPDLIQVPVSQLQLGPSGYDAINDTYVIKLDRIIAPDVQSIVTEAPITVYRAGVEARIKHGNLILLGIETHPNADVVNTANTISRDAAIDRAIALSPAPNAEHTFETARKVVLAEDAGRGLAYRLTWEIRTRTQTPNGIWVSHLDAHTGELVNLYNEVRYLTGAAEGEHDLRTVDGELAISPLRFARLDGDTGEAVYTDENGLFNVVADATATLTLRGGTVRVANQNGSNAALVVGEGGGVLDTSSATRAEIDTFVFLNEVQAWGDDYAPYVNENWSVVVSNVNIDNTCNANFNGNVNFFRAGRGCNNTARIADVNYHEWGHGFHYFSLFDVNRFDGSISEGIADTVSFLHTRDNILAPYFFTNGNGIRNVAPDRRYPEDFFDGQVHNNGLIFGGSIWDLWGVLEDKSTPDAALDTVSRLLAAAVRPGPTIPEAFDEFMVADDDDGDLGNGTPNYCEIVDAFGRHGLGPSGTGVSVLLSHLPLGNQPVSADGYSVNADFLNFAPNCLDDVETLEVVYSTDDGERWERAPLSDGEGSFAGTIPQQASGTTVLYYIEGQTTGGDALSAPFGGEITPLSFFVGDLIEIYCEDFERSDGDYTSALLGGEEGQGADDWQWGVPGGLAGDPAFAASGDRVWGNDLGGVIDGQQWNGEYQGDKHNQLLSPEIDLFNPEDEEYAGPYIVQFQRWLSVEDSYYDIARVTFNDDEVWTNYASPPSTAPAEADTHHADSQWALQTLVYTGEADALQIGWEIESDAGLHFGGWNIDDVCVYAVVPAEEPEEPEEGRRGNNTSSGCATSGGSTGGLLAGLLAACLVGMRRRRR